MKGFILALQFLTRFPIPISIDFNSKNLKSSLFFFPIVSGLIGLCLGGVHYLLSPIDMGVAALISSLLWIFFNGGLHMDGLADMLDGFLANKDRKATLEIMKDSRVGTFGVIALIFVILSKFVLLNSIQVISPITMGVILLSARMGVLHSIAFFPSARSNGLGRIFQEGKPQSMVLILSIIFAFLIPLLDFKLIIVYIFGILNGYAISFWSVKKIGGVTGDIFGAIMEIGEVVTLITFWGVGTWNLF